MHLLPAGEVVLGLHRMVDLTLPPATVVHRYELVTGPGRADHRAGCVAVVAVTGGLQGSARRSQVFASRATGWRCSTSPRARPTPATSARLADVERAIAAAEADLGPLDVSSTTPASPRSARPRTSPRELWQRSLDVMTSGVFFCSRVAGKRMLARGRGSIINISSINATEAFPQRLAYCAAKAAVES